MTTENTNGTDTTNGTAPTKTPSPLIALRVKFEADGGKFKDGAAVLTTAQMKEAKAAAKELSAAQAKVDAAKSALDSAKEDVYKASVKLLGATGCTSITVGGVQYVPMSKEDRAFYRPLGQRSSMDLG